MDLPEPALPDVIGRYQVVRALGHGAMGRVLLARDPVLDRLVAIKLLRDDLKLPPEQRQSLFDRMRQEARASARVLHPNIVSLHDMGEDADLGLYLVFEYVEGATLKERLARGPLGPEAAAKLAREIGDALNTAHAAGVLHRDIKPENLILSRTGAKIADFGIARVPDSTLTRDGGLLGTPAYSAPESIHHGKFSPLTDQFSLAATLYEAISGRRAFPGEDALAVATRIATEYPPPIAAATGLDPHVDTVLTRALDKEPKKRWPSADDFGRALSEALLSAPRTRMPTLPDQRREQAMRHGAERRSARLAVGGFVVGALLGSGGVWLLARASAQPATLPSAAPPPPQPIGFLAENPHARAKRPNGASEERSARATHDQDAGAQQVADASDDSRSDLPTAMNEVTDGGKSSRDASAKPASSSKPSTNAP
jgi:serine/threonine-protein kinase